MKRSSTLRLTLMASTLPLALTACDNPAINGQNMLAEMERQNQQARLERAAAEAAAATAAAAAAVDCSTAELMQTDACKSEIERLMAESPRFDTRDDCLMQTGTDCQQVNINGQNSWIPPLLGFAGGMILAEAIDEIGDSVERRRRYSSSPYRDRYRTGSYPSSGRSSYPTTSRSSYPSASAPPPPPPPTRAITQSRSGFGSTASARSSFGGFGG